MTEPHFERIYEIGPATFGEWWIALIALGLGCVGAIWLSIELAAMPRTRVPRPQFMIAMGATGMSLLMNAMVMLAFIEHVDLCFRHATGSSVVIEGPIEELVRVPHKGYLNDRFAVQGTRFAISDYEIRPGWNRTIQNGSPLVEGVYVRLWHVDEDITRIDVRKP